MEDLLNPANIIVLAAIVVGMFFGLRRIVASTHGKSCCSDGTSGKKAKKVVVADTDPSHYPYSDELLIGGMSCDGCAQNVANALNALNGVWATVTYADTRRACAQAANRSRCSRGGREGCGLLRHDAVSAALDALPCLGSSAQFDVKNVIEIDGDVFELEELEGREYLVEDAGAGAIAVRIVIGDAD